MADGIGARFDGVSYSAADERRLDATLMMNAGAGLGRPGVRPGISSLVTIGSSPESATIAPHNGTLLDSAGGGAFRYCVPSTVAINLAARPSAGQSRLDEVIAVVKNSDVRPADLVKEIDLQVLTGTPSAGTPTAPTIPTGAVKLAELSVPASGTVSVNIASQRMVALGGILPVASSTERDAVTNPYDGLVVYREDTGRYEALAGGAWQALVADSGWKTLTLTGTTGWTVDAARYRVLWPQVWLDIKVTRTGSTLTANSLGNITDVSIATGGIPSSILPNEGWDLRGSMPNLFDVGWQLRTDSSMLLTYFSAPGGTVAAGNQLKLRDSYPLG